MRRKLLRNASPYLVLGLVAAPFIAMYVVFFLQAFDCRLVTNPSGCLRPNVDSFSFLSEPIAWGLGQTTIWIVLRNTLFFATTSALVVTVTAMLAGYALSRIDFRGKGFFLAMQLVLHAIPGEILLIATFLLLFYMGLLNQIPGVAFARAALEIPLGVWLAKGFFDDIPLDVERAAMVDGATRLQAWYRVLLPLIGPGVATVFIWGFLMAWHDFIYVFTLLPGTTRVMATLIQNLLATEVVDYGYLAALSLVYTLPPMILFVYLQRTLITTPLGGGKGA